MVGRRAATTCAPVSTVANPRADALGVTRWYNVVWYVLTLLQVASRAPLQRLTKLTRVNPLVTHLWGLRSPSVPEPLRVLLYFERPT